MNNITTLLTIQDVANRLKVTPQYARKLIKEEKLTATRIGSQWVIKPDDLDAYISKYDISIEPNDHARIGTDIPDIVALSFFSGAMGLDVGMRNGGIPAILACEFNKYCRMTIDKNEPDMVRLLQKLF